MTNTKFRILVACEGKEGVIKDSNTAVSNVLVLKRDDGFKGSFYCYMS